MPYNPDNPPEKLKNLSAAKKRQWVEVFNSCYEKHHDDAKCHKMAWGVVGKSASCTDCDDLAGIDWEKAAADSLREVAREIADERD